MTCYRRGQRRQARHAEDRSARGNRSPLHGRQPLDVVPAVEPAAAARMPAVGCMAEPHEPRKLALRIKAGRGD